MVKAGLHYVIRDCWLDENQEIWSKQSNVEDQHKDHKEMSRQINIYKMKLILKGVDISSEIV